MTALSPQSQVQGVDTGSLAGAPGHVFRAGFRFDGGLQLYEAKILLLKLKAGLPMGLLISSSSGRCGPIAGLRQG